MDSYLPYVGFVQFPRGPLDLAGAVCPACLVPRAAVTCANCGLSLSSPLVAEIDAASMDAATALDRRLELIGRIRFESHVARFAADNAARETSDTALSPPPIPSPAIHSLAGAVPAVPPAPAPMPMPAPAPAPVGLAPAPVADAPPRRHVGVQVILLIVGVSLLSVGAIFFLVYAFITFGLAWRSVIIAAVTIASFVGAGLLKKRRLGATAEAIAALAVVFVYLDAFALRANDLLGAGASDALVYWGVALVVSAVGFTLWSRTSGLRLPALVAALAFSPGLALLAAGLSGNLDDITRLFIACVTVALAGLVHRLLPTSAERRILLSLTVAGLAAAAFTSLVLEPRFDWAPAVALPIVAVVALTHVVVLVRATVVTVFAPVIAALGAVAASLAVLIVATRVGDTSFLVSAPPIAAITVALALELLTRRSAGSAARRATVTAAWSAAAVAALTLLIPVANAAATTASVILAGSRWSLSGAYIHRAEPGSGAAVAALALAVGLTAAAWSVGKTARRRATALLAASIAVAIFAVPLLGMLWAVVLVWLLLGAAGVAVLVSRRIASPGILITVAVGATIATALGYSASWASIDTWWYGSVVTVAIVIAARWATKAEAARAALLGLASVLALVAAGAEGLHINERFSDGAFAGLDSVHAVAIVAILLLAVSSGLSAALSRIEARVLFWISLLVALTAGGLSWSIASGEPVRASQLLVLAWPAVSVLLALALVLALTLWVALPRTAPFRVERIVASVAVTPALAWLLDSIARALQLQPFIAVLGPIVAVLIASAISLALNSRLSTSRDRVARWARDAGIGLVAVPAVFVAMATAGASTWLVLLLGGVAALMLSVSRDGLFRSQSSRKQLGWVALVLATAALWWRLAEDGLRDVEPYVLPLAGAILLIAALAWRADRDGRGTLPALITLGGLLVAVLPIALAAISGDLVRAMIIAAVAAALLLLGSWLPATTQQRPYLDVAALAGSLGVVVTAIGRPTVMAIDRTVDDPSLDAWLATGLVVAVVAAIGQSRVRHDASRTIRSWFVTALVGIALAGVLLVELAVLQTGPLGTTRAMAVLLTFCVIHVVGLLVDRLPFTAPFGWVSIGFAGLIWVWALSVGAIDPLEWGTVPIATALLVVGAVKLRRSAPSGSWAWLAPGTLMLLLPSLIATITDQPIWRLVALGAACIIAIVIGAVRKLQAPLLIGAAVVLVHALRTFAPQLLAVYQLTQWWVWAVVGGAIILFIALTFERRVRDLKAVGSRISALR